MGYVCFCGAASSQPFRHVILHQPPLHLQRLTVRLDLQRRNHVWSVACRRVDALRACAAEAAAATTIVAAIIVFVAVVVAVVVFCTRDAAGAVENRVIWKCGTGREGECARYLTVLCGINS